MRMLSGAVLVLAAALVVAGLVVGEATCFAAFKGNSYSWPFGMACGALFATVTGAAGSLLLILGALKDRDGQR